MRHARSKVDDIHFLGGWLYWPHEYVDEINIEDSPVPFTSSPHSLIPDIECENLGEACVGAPVDGEEDPYRFWRSMFAPGPYSGCGTYSDEIGADGKLCKSPS